MTGVGMTAALRAVGRLAASRADRRALEARASDARVYVARDGRGRVLACR